MMSLSHQILHSPGATLFPDRVLLLDKKNKSLFLKLFLLGFLFIVAKGLLTEIAVKIIVFVIIAKIY